MIEQQRESSLYVRRNVYLRGAREGSEMNIEIRRVAVVIARLLEVHAVASNVPRQLFHQDASPGRAPPSGSPEFGKRRAKIEQAQSFTGQVSVWAEVMR